MGSEGHGIAAATPMAGGQLEGSNGGTNLSNIASRKANRKGSPNSEASVETKGSTDEIVGNGFLIPQEAMPVIDTEKATTNSRRMSSSLSNTDLFPPPADMAVDSEEFVRANSYKNAPQLQTTAHLENEQQEQYSRSPFCVSTMSAVPHQDARHLDPAAQEFTPGPSPTFSNHLHAPVALAHHPLEGHFVPTTAGTGMEARPFVFSHDYNGGAILPFYAHEPQVGYCPMVSSSPSWDGQTIGIAMRELSPSAPLLPPPVLVQPQLPQHFSVSTYGLPQTPMVHGPYNCPPSMPLQTPPAAPCIPPPSVWREHMSRALQLIGVPTELPDGQLRRELEQWGEIRALQLEGRSEGMVTVHYFDLRSARAALTDIQHQHLTQQRRMQEHFHQLHQRQQYGGVDGSEDDCHRHGISRVASTQDVTTATESSYSRGLIGGKATWAQYTIPVGLPTHDSHNQGTLVVFNLDVDIAMDVVRATFERYGSVKELRETPSKRQHKFVEFFDIRDAAAALNALDGQDIGGKKVKIEFSRPGGQARRARAQSQLCLTSMQAQPNRLDLGPASMAVRGQPVYMGWGSEPDSASQVGYMWSNYTPLGAPAAAFPPQPPLNEQQVHHHGAYGMPVHPKTFAPMQAGANGSATGGRARLTSIVTPRCFNGLGYGQGNVSGKGGKIAFEGPPRRRKGNSPGSRMDSTNSLITSADGKVGSKGCLGAGRINSSELQAQYKFDEAEAESSVGNARTTLMIRNIPNKYSQQMLLALLDEHCVHVNSQIVDPGEPISAYDFVYLPIDFKNRCNLGYAFVNFTTGQATVKVHKAFNGRQWEEFNSRKICEVTYARVQGRAALEDHFRNSRFACDTDEYLPLVFSPPRTGLECPSPRVVGSQVSDCDLNPSGIRNSSSVHEDGDSETSVAMREMNWDPTTALAQGCVPGSSSFSSGMEPHDVGDSSSSNGRNWTGVGIALGRRLSGHHRGVLQGQRFGRVM